MDDAAYEIDVLRPQSAHFADTEHDERAEQDSEPDGLGKQIVWLPDLISGPYLQSCWARCGEVRREHGDFASCTSWTAWARVARTVGSLNTAAAAISSRSPAYEDAASGEPQRGRPALTADCLDT